MNYCLTHNCVTKSPVTNGVDSEGCLIVSCPPPEMEEDWELHVVPPTPQEIHAMDLHATELVTSWA